MLLLYSTFGLIQLFFSHYISVSAVHLLENYIVGAFYKPGTVLEISGKPGRAPLPLELKAGLLSLPLLSCEPQLPAPG